MTYADRDSLYRAIYAWRLLCAARYGVDLVAGDALARGVYRHEAPMSDAMRTAYRTAYDRDWPEMNEGK